MKVINRDGTEVSFQKEKIITAIFKANQVTEQNRLTEEQINEAAEYISFKCSRMSRAVSVEEIQDMVENQIMAQGAFDVAKNYVRYRFAKTLIRKTTQQMIGS